MKISKICLAGICICAAGAMSPAFSAPAPALVFDLHEDIPLFLHDGIFDFVSRSGRETDLPKLEEGGVNAVFLALWTPGSEDWEQMNLRVKEMVHQTSCIIRSRPEEIELTDSSAGIRRIVASHRIAGIYGIEGGHALNNSVAELRIFRGLGVRYVTLTHDRTHGWGDAAMDAPKWGGLNALGRKIVRQMNRLGIVPDLTHAADATFFDAVDVSRGPIFISHSAARGLVDNPLNASDAMLDALKKNGGVIGIILFDPQVNRNLDKQLMTDARARVQSAYGGDPMKLWDAVFDLMKERRIPRATVRDVADHIDYVRRRIGIDHVGIGTDFLGGAKVEGLENIAQLPALTAELKRRGYSKSDIDKVMGSNAMRVLEQTERLADRKAIPRPARLICN